MRLWWHLVRLGFRLLYNEFAFTYDFDSWVVSLGAWRCWVRASLKHLHPVALILELAHGTGNLQVALNDAGFHAVGYDLSPTMGKIAQGKLQKQNYPARLTQGYAQALPFADGTFASVVSTFPTDFIVAVKCCRSKRRSTRRWPRAPQCKNAWSCAASTIRPPCRRVEMFGGTACLRRWTTVALPSRAIENRHWLSC